MCQLSRFFCCLGLRYPSEKTVQALVALGLAMSAGPAEALRMNSTAKHVYVVEFKRLFKLECARHPRPPFLVRTFPADP